MSIHSKEHKIIFYAPPWRYRLRILEMTLTTAKSSIHDFTCVPNSVMTQMIDKVLVHNHDNDAIKNTT